MSHQTLAKLHVALFLLVLSIADSCAEPKSDDESGGKADLSVEKTSREPDSSEVKHESNVNESEVQAHNNELKRYRSQSGDYNLMLSVPIPPSISDEELASFKVASLSDWYSSYLGVELRRPDGSLAYSERSPSAVIYSMGFSSTITFSFVESPVDAKSVSVYTVSLVGPVPVGEIVRFELSPLPIED